MEPSNAAITAVCDAGWLFDHCRSITNDVSSYGAICPSYLFAVEKPYFLTKRTSEECTTSQKYFGQTLNDVKAKRKRKIRSDAALPDNLGDISKIKDFLLATLKKLLNDVKDGSNPMSLVFNHSSSCGAEGNRCIPNDSINFVELCDLAMQLSQDIAECDTVLLENDTEMIADVFNKVVKNTRDSPVLMKALGADFIIPSLSVFMMSDVENLGNLLDGGTIYDLVVVDPPWNNKSAKRAKRYKCLSLQDVKSLPVPKVISAGSLVAIWVTNNQKIIDFVKEELFQTWSLKLVAEWFWLKITTTGSLVCESDSVHKKPYERLFIGRLVNGAEKQAKLDVAFPYQKVVCSIPCRMHSRKPPLNEILADFLPSKPRCLELFARNLLPGWTSWGNEAVELMPLCRQESSQRQ